MRREPEEKQPFQERLLAWLKQRWQRVKEVVNELWQQFIRGLKQFCNRYHLTRWLIVIFLGLFLVTSTYLTFFAKTADVKN